MVVENFSRMVNYRRRPRKSSNPRRAWTNSIQDELQSRPSDEKKVACNKPRESKPRKIVGFARDTTRLPNLVDDQQNSDHEKSRSKVQTSRKRKREAVDIDDQVVLQNSNDNASSSSSSSSQQNQVVLQNSNNNASSSSQRLLPVEFKNYIEEELGVTEEPVLVIHKKLFKSDVDRGLQRLSIPVNQVVNQGFLTEEERSRFRSDNKDEEIDAILIEPSLVESKIRLKKWYMVSSATYNLMSGWKDVVERNGLEEGTEVQLWSFKRGSQLYFILIKVERDSHESTITDA